MRSPHLRQLERRFRALRRQYLPRQFSKTGSYSDEKYLDAMAFRLLFYAEMESYFELLALDFLDNICASALAGSYTRGVAALLTTFKADEMHAIPTQQDQIKSTSYLVRSIKACRHKHRQKIENNKGAKTHNLMSMFVVLGLDETGIEDQLLIDLNTFGSQRGEVAHKGFGYVTQLPDPRDEKILAERIIELLKDFETLLG